jgi:hypothetical protein
LALAIVIVQKLAPIRAMTMAASGIDWPPTLASYRKSLV